MLKKIVHIGASVTVVGIVAVFVAQSSVPWASSDQGAVAIADAQVALGFDLTEPAKQLKEVRFTDAEGALVTLEDRRGTVVLINFWATWCPPCVREMPSLERLQAELGGDGFEVLAISEDREATAIAPFYKHFGLKELRSYHDPYGRLARQLKVTGFPTTILVDHRGFEVGRVMGAAEWDSPEAIALMSHYLDKSISAASAD